MTRTTVNHVGTDRIDDHAPPGGTAIVRPLRHVRAVREHDAAQSADLSEARSARAWAWALGESAAAPVTDRVTAVPPGRSDIEAEITAADERLFRGERRTGPMPPQSSCAGSSATTITSQSKRRIRASWSAGSATSSAHQNR